MKTGLAEFVRILGRGQHLSRSLTQPEAREAMRRILAGDAAPEAVGAFLMLLRYRGETAAEIAGMVEAMREGLEAWRMPHAQLDWPSYAAGKSRGLPLFLLSARLLAQNGIPVAMHGYNSHLSHSATTRAAIEALGMSIATDAASARKALLESGFVYIALEALNPCLLELLCLREALGLRSCVNTALRALNPSGAPASMQGVFHPPYLALQRDTGGLLGQERLSVFKGGAGEAERNPAKAMQLYVLRGGVPSEYECAALYKGEARRLAGDAPPDLAELVALWRGERKDDFSEAVVIGTAALAIETVGAAENEHTALALAERWWQQRNTHNT